MVDISKATPRPWRVFHSKRGTYIGVGEETGEGILDAGFGLWRSGTEREANAQLAVRAVNAHDDLVEALKGLLLATGDGPRREAASIVARAALAKAGVK